MHRALPVSNRILDQRQRENNARIHLEHLNAVRPTIDSSAPRSFKHLQFKSKREQMKEQRYTQIQRANQILLNKMSGIVAGKPKKQEIRVKKSLNEGARKRQLMKISEQNQHFLKRLKSKRPSYSIKDWEQERKTNEKRLKSICMFPYQLSAKDKKRPVSEQRKMRYENSRGATAIGGSRPRHVSAQDPSLVFRKGISIDDIYLVVQIRKKGEDVVLTANDLDKNGNYKLEIPSVEVQNLVGGEDYSKLVEMLQFDNGELVLIAPTTEEEALWIIKQID